MGFVFAYLLSGCLYLEPSPEMIDRQIHQMKTPPTEVTTYVSPPLWTEEILPLVRQMRGDGWWVHDQYPAGGVPETHEVPFAGPGWWAGSNFDPSLRRDVMHDPIRHKTIVVFRRYGD